MRSASRAAFLSWSVLGLVGCASISGLDQIQESPCVIDCDASGDDASDDLGADTGSGADATQAPDTAAADGAGDGSNRGDGSSLDARADAHGGSDGTVEGDASTPDADAGSEVDAPDDATAMDTSAPDSPPDVTTVDAPPDTSPEAAVEAGCGSTDTVENCGACGVACAAGAASGVRSATCTGVTCTYQCLAGHLDCNIGAPDTDGCECPTPNSTTATCCGTSCPTSHTTGYPTNPSGQPETFYDCNTSLNQQVAMEACTQYSGSVNDCVLDTSSCAGNEFVVCNTGASTPATEKCVCWAFQGPNAGWATAGSTRSCYCPTGSAATDVPYQ